ncbi:hypothetical protein LTR10_014996 [Elasticomyces elasticus]|nr:hypothetical protein LTR10_014996 [Elasticomyces elasticus]KAK4964573.1 hypothetical protein LTR42_012870 [Elasticomyces elasticus]
MFDTTASPRRENESRSDYSWRVMNGVVRVDGQAMLPDSESDTTDSQRAREQATIEGSNSGSNTSPDTKAPYVPIVVGGYMMPSKPPPSYVERQRVRREAELMAFINADPEIQALDAERLLREQTDRDKYLPPKLPMIHFREYDGRGVPAQNPPKLVFVDPSTATYELGGKVHRVFALTPGGHQDVMMCNMAICGYCKDLYTPTSSESMEMMSSAGDWYYFPDGARPYQIRYPQMKRANVVFTVKGSEEGTPAIETMMCDAGHCEDCKSKRDEEMDV